MGLGKTLQALTLLWTMLNEGHPLLGGTPLARRAVICCPTSLVGNWEAEARKFLRGRLRVQYIDAHGMPEVCGRVCVGVVVLCVVVGYWVCGLWVVCGFLCSI